MENAILKLIENDAKISASQIALALGIDENEVREIIHGLEESGIIAGYKTLIDWDKAGREDVTALIEIKVIPQLGQGFERIAKRLSQYSEVESVYLMSGGFDVAVMVTGSSLREVACFVSDKIAPLEYVTATATHFVLHKFKDKGIVYSDGVEKQERICAF